MATNYPAGLDNLTNPVTTDPVNSPSHAVQHANANDAIEALQEKVGTNNSLVTTSIDYRVRQLEANPVGTANKITQLVINNTGSTLAKGKVVYASGSVGASGQLRVSLSSNAAESTSSKTFGVLAEQIIQGGQGTVVCEGLLENIDTTGANDGDPIWLGTNGSMIFGLVNKPVAPAHLVFVGIVVRGGNANNGSIFVKVQNGFELDELHTVLLSSLADKDLLAYDSATGLWKNKTFTTLDIPTKTYVDTALSNLSNTVTTDYVPISDVGQPDGVASLDSTGKIPLAQMGNLVAGAPTALDTLNELAAALGDDANFASTVTTSLSDKASLTSANTFTTSPQTINIASTSAVGLVVQASVGQTTDIQQWKNSSGNVIARLTKDATLSVGSSSVAPGIITAVAFSAGQNPIVVQGASGQTGDLQIWRNSAGTVLAAVSNTGTIRSSIFANTTGGLTYIATNFDTSGIGIVAISAAQKGLIVRGAASQTANLQEWQDSAGTVLAKVDASGIVTSKGIQISNGPTVTTGTNNLIIGDSNTGSSITAQSNNVMIGASAGIYNFGSNNTYIGVGRVISGGNGGQNVWIGSGAGASTHGYSGNILIGYQAGQSIAASNQLVIANSSTTTPLIGGDFSAKTLTFAGNVTITSQAAGTVATIIKGATSQTADLQQWQNNAGTALAKVDSAGGFTAGNTFLTSTSSSTVGLTVTAATGQTSTNIFEVQRAGGGDPSFTVSHNYIDLNRNTTAAASMTVYGPNAGAVPLYVKGRASQTADLQQWQNSSGTVNARIDAYGTFQNGTAGGYGAWINVQPAQASDKGIIIRGAASQTANLQEWQNSSGTVLASIASTGQINAGAGFYTDWAGVGTGRIGAAHLSVSSQYLGNIVSIFKGVSGQTANLTEWQNSSGAILASVSAGGDLTIPSARVAIGITAPISLVMLGTVAAGATFVPIVAKGAASQTADLQQWQNSAGTVLAKITSTGAFDATAITVNGSPISGGLTPFSISSNTGLSSNSKYFVNTSAARTLTLPASPSVGDEIQVFDASNLAGTNNVTISSNGGKINGSVQDAIVDVNGGAMVLIYTGSTYGWRVG